MSTSASRSQSIKVNPCEFPEFPVEHFARPQGWYGESKIDPRVKEYEVSEHSESSMNYDHSERSIEEAFDFRAGGDRSPMSTRGRLSTSSTRRNTVTGGGGATNLIKATAWVHPPHHQEIFNRPDLWMGTADGSDPSAEVVANRRRSKRPSQIKINGYN